MKTNLAQFIKDTPEGREANSILRACVHCGFCTATCPTYQLLGDELDGPRGRIYLMKEVLEGREVTAKTQLHLDRCLTCRSCETTCPSGVKYGRLVDIGRNIVEQRVGRAHDRSAQAQGPAHGPDDPVAVQPAARAGPAYHDRCCRHASHARCPPRRARRHGRRHAIAAACWCCRAACSRHRAEDQSSAGARARPDRHLAGRRPEAGLLRCRVLSPQRAGRGAGRTCAGTSTHGGRTWSRVSRPS